MRCENKKSNLKRNSEFKREEKKRFDLTDLFGDLVATALYSSLYSML